MNKRSTKKSGMENRPAGSVLVLYENPSAREQAAGFCDELVRPPGMAARSIINWCSFEQLAVPQNADELLRAAVYADLLAFAVTPAGDLPEAIKLWTERWLAGRGEREGSLVGLILEEGGRQLGVAGLKEIYLRHLAHRAGMDYLSHFPGQITRPIPNSLDSFNQRAGRITPVLDEILHTHFVPPSLPLK